MKRIEALYSLASLLMYLVLKPAFDEHERRRHSLIVSYPGKPGEKVIGFNAGPGSSARQFKRIFRALVGIDKETK